LRKPIAHAGVPVTSCGDTLHVIIAMKSEHDERLTVTGTTQGDL
jgi:hypothetical protein